MMFRRQILFAATLSLVAAACSSTPRAMPEAAPMAASEAGPRIVGGVAGLAIPPEDTVTAGPAIVQASVDQELRRFRLPPGYRLEPVLTEPAIKEPAAIAFDGNGRLFVLELRGYMQDADATGELDPVGQISMHEDVDNDGVYETHHVFVDGLVFPRFVMPFGANSILTMESNEDEVYRFTDTDGDGRADKKELFTTHYGRSGNVEHQQAFLYWGMDNWMYSTYNAFRIRWTPDGILREPTGSNRAQWGVTQDNEGKIWFQGGASGLPSYFQFPIHYGNYDVDQPYADGFKVPYGLAGVGDFQPGPGASRPNGTLNEVTGSAGNDIFRGHRLPADLVGHYFYGEPVARIVRRVEPVVTEGLTRLHNVYQADSSEFIRSTDPLFRPVDLATAPDGTLYITDMYRGIIQEGNWTRKGSFLRAKIEQYSLDKNIGHGRIWRVTYDGMPRDTERPRMLDETPAQLVRHLAHPNGWWRDTAQQLLVLQQDRSVVPALVDLARQKENLLARYHALWTLEGLGALDKSLARELMQDAEPGMRIQALRASETLYKAGATALGADFRRLSLDKNPDVAIQAMLTMDVLGAPETEAAVKQAMASSPAEGVQFVAAKILEKPESPWPGFTGSTFRLTDAQKELLTKGVEIYGELCAQCHGETGRGTPFGGSGQTLAPALAASPRLSGHRDYVIKTLLYGQTGPIEGKSYPGDLMVAMGENDDTWIASVASYVGNSFSNEGGWVTPEDVARVRAANAGRTAPWKHDELMASLPRLIEPRALKATASHNAAGGSGAFNFAGWSTQAPQEPGMWFQIELPEPAPVAEIQYTANMQRFGRPPDAPPPQFTSPRGYEVRVSMDGTTWSEPVAAGSADGWGGSIVFEPVQARFIRITQTATLAEPRPAWTMQEVRVYAR
ncbi:MAG: discoidin domain-containing protein [Rhodothermales bacterium]